MYCIHAQFIKRIIDVFNSCRHDRTMLSSGLRFRTRGEQFLQRKQLMTDNECYILISAPPSSPICLPATSMPVQLRNEDALGSSELLPTNTNPSSVLI